MATLVEKLRCGNCGGDRFSVWSYAPEDAGRFGGGSLFHGKIHLVCPCGTQTEVAAYEPPPSLAIKSVAGDGSICGGWRDPG